MNPSEQLYGTIDRFLFANEQTGFSVFILQSKKQDDTVVTGTFANVQAGQEIHLQGSWTFHAKFGKQFQAQSYTTSLPTSALGIKKYLGSGLIKGIGKVYAEKIVTVFQEKTLDIIDQTPELLLQVEGIGQKRYELIKASWVDQKFIAKIMVFLQEKGVSSAFATKIYKAYGHNSIAKVTQNPYQMTDDIWGIGFKTADKIAQNLGFDVGSPKRIQAGILYTLKEQSNSGHIYQEVQPLKQKTFQLLELEPELHAQAIKHALTNAYEQDQVKLISYQDKHFVGLSALYGSEKGFATKILKLLQAPSKHNLSSQAIYTALQKAMDLQLNEQQQQGVIACFEHKISIITGGPGTGKTTMIKALLNLLEHYKIDYKLAAPTGRAAKRLMESTRRHATTLHRLLEFDPATMRFVHNEENALQTDFLIVDEASMIDVFLAHSLIKAVPLPAHVIFIGDIDQLPSVGPGSVLKDLIESEKIACTRLSYIFRQAHNSMIIANAHKINQGEFPSSSLENSKKDFYFIKEEFVENCATLIKKLFKTTIAQHHIAPHQVMVLTPMNRGACGTQTLNHELQQFLNQAHSHETITYFGTTYRTKDRVMQIKNNYDKKVFNGDLGTIDSIDTQEKTITVNFDDTLVSYSHDELSELVLSYAVTIHKSQGSEYDAVIIPIFMQHFMLLQRNLLYTAITRAKKLCIFVGQTKAISMGIKNAKQQQRITFLKQFLTENISCR